MIALETRSLNENECDEEQKNLRAYCIDRLGGSQRQDPEVFEDI